MKWSTEEKRKKTETSALITERPLHEVMNNKTETSALITERPLHEVMNNKTETSALITERPLHEVMNRKKRRRKKHKKKTPETSALITERLLHELMNQQNWTSALITERPLHEVTNWQNWDISTNNWEAITWNDEHLDKTQTSALIMTEMMNINKTKATGPINETPLHQLMNRQNQNMIRCTENNWGK